MSDHTETARARIARLHGEAARVIMLDLLGPAHEATAAAFGAALEKAAASSMSGEMVALLQGLSDEQVIAAVRPHMEPGIRERLVREGRLPS